MHFKEEEKESNSLIYRVYDIYQSVNDTKRFKRDLFNYEKAKEEEQYLSRIKCPLLGKRSSTDQQRHSRSGAEHDRKHDDRNDQNDKPSLISQDERKAGADERPKDDRRKHLSHFSMRIHNKVMVMSEESIWEDSLGANLNDIVAEITDLSNYATEDTEMTEKSTEALCIKALRDILSTNQSALIQKLKEENEEDVPERAKKAV